MTNPYAPPRVATAEPAPLPRWRRRAALALRLYVASQFATVAVATVNVALVRTSITPGTSSLATSDLRTSPYPFFQAAYVAADALAVVAFLLTVARPRSQTRATSVLGSLLALLYWPVCALVSDKERVVVLALILAVQRLTVLLFALTAISVAQDLGDGREKARLWAVVRWQASAIVVLLIGILVEGSAGASPLGIAVPALVAFVAHCVLLIRGVPAFLRIARALRDARET